MKPPAARGLRPCQGGSRVMISICCCCCCYYYYYYIDDDPTCASPTSAWLSWWQGDLISIISISIRTNISASTVLVLAVYFVPSRGDGSSGSRVMLS